MRLVEKKIPNRPMKVGDRAVTFAKYPGTGKKESLYGEITEMKDGKTTIKIDGKWDKATKKMQIHYITVPSGKVKHEECIDVYF